MPLAVMAVFLAFGMGGGLGMLLLARLRLPLWLHVPVAIAPLGVYLPLVLGLPFAGALSELPIVVAGACAIGAPVSLFFRLARRHEERKAAQPAAAPRANLVGAVALGLTLPIVAAVVTTLLSRLNYAERLAWSCDGTIVEHTRATGNHNSPELVVKSGERLESFVFVTDDLWSQAKVGQHLTKVAGSPMATLDGQRLRMVPRGLEWWHDPP